MDNSDVAREASTVCASGAVVGMEGDVHHRAGRLPKPRRCSAAELREQRRGYYLFLKVCVGDDLNG
eukprot:10925329-Lingulodinium_polyedra.AAC.1